MCQLINEPTRTESRRNVVHKSCIDHITTSVPRKCLNSEVVVEGNSDHLAVITTKLSREINSRPAFVKKRSYKYFSKENFLLEVRNTSFRDILALNNSEEAAKLFSQIFGQILDNHAPVKVFQSRNNYAPWLSDKTKEDIRKRNLLKKNSIYSNDPAVLISYKQLRNEIKSRLRKEEISYYNDKFKNRSISSKDLWKNAYEILGQHKDTSPTQINHESKVIQSPAELAETFNEIFLSKVQRLKSAISSDNSRKPIDSLTTWLSKRELPLNTFSFKPVDITSLRKFIKKLKGSRSSGIDQIDSFSIKLAAPYIEDVLLHLVNLSLVTYPQSWKNQLVHPFHKKGDKGNGENYRPVSHIVEVSKLAEYAVLDQVLEHFEVNQLFHQNHHGFLPNRNTATALLQIYDIWLNNAEDKKITGTIFLDLSAAFDIVDHRILLSKLGVYGFSAESLSFFESYLSKRKQQVQVNSKVSSPKDIGDQGVPQGSILGPLLFLIFMNDFPEHCDTGDSIMYADDDSEVVSDHNPDRLEEKLQLQADSATKWIAENKMLCSGEKTKLLIVSTKEQRNLKLHGRPIRIHVGNNIIQETKEEKLLGITMSNTLTWNTYLYGNQQSGGLLSKLSQRIGMLTRLNCYMSGKQFKMMCDGLFTSTLLYCLPLFVNTWGLPSMDDTSRKSPSFTKEDCRRLQVLQNKVMRNITKNRINNTSTKELLGRANYLSINQLGAYHSLLTVARMFTSGKPEYFAKKLTRRYPNSEGIFPARQMNNVNVCSYKLSISRSGFLYRAGKLWNHLPESLRTERKVSSFKTELRKWIKEFIPVKPL